jgi:ribosomal protein L1
MLPHGTGKAVRVGVFATGEDAAAAKAAGARADGGPARCYP